MPDSGGRIYEINIEGHKLHLGMQDTGVHGYQWPEISNLFTHLVAHSLRCSTLPVDREAPNHPPRPLLPLQTGTTQVPDDVT